MTTVQKSNPNLKSENQAFLEKFPDLILCLNSEGQILSTNSKCTSMLGYDTKEFVGKRLSDFFFDELEKEKYLSKSYECRLKTKDNTILPAEIRTFLTDNSKSPVLAIVRDLREATELRSKIFYNGKFAAMNELAPSLIHDIRNSLSILSAQHYFMKHNVDKLDTQKFLDGLDIIQKASLKIEKITNQVRDLLNGNENVSIIFLRELVEKVIFLLEPKTRKINAWICNEVPTDIEINCVPQQIEQVFFNLLDNAVDAVSTAQEKTIRVEAKHQDSIQITVQDSGVGMDETLKSQIFNPFFTTKAKGESSGLGLYICKQVLARHGAQIKVTSEAGRGSSFVITFPPPMK